MRATGTLLATAALVAAGVGVPGLAGIERATAGTASAAADLGPATPQRLYATNGATSITLSWTQPRTGPRPVSFRVYEAGTVVARNTTTHVTVRNLVFNSAHTYSVTAIDQFGRESARSATISRTALIGGPFACGLTAPSSLVATDVTASGVSVSWSNAQPYYDQPGTLVVLLDGAALAQTTLDSIRISGLAPASTHTVTIARRDCTGTLHPSAPLTVTTTPGPTARPAAPTSVSVTARTNSSITLAWSAPAAGTDPPAGYAVYDGGALMATTTATGATISGLWRETGHVFTISALDPAGQESAQSTAAAASTLPCDPVVPAPTALTVRPRTASTVALSWASIAESTGFAVYRSGVAVGTVDGDAQGGSAVVTGLPSNSAADYAVTAQTAACGSSAPSRPVTASTLPGPTARPQAPTQLSVTGTGFGSGNTGTVTLAWSQPASADPVLGYRLYEGADVLATVTTPGLTLTLPAGPRHAVAVVAVDSAGNESALDGPVRFTVPFIPPP